MASPRALQLISVAVLCAVGAELLAAYGDSTGDPGLIVFSLIFFGALYAAPALLARELVRRAGWGWPSLLLLFAALGIAEACVIDQSMFNDGYQGYEGWEESWEATLVAPLGINAYNTANFIPGHVIFSFGAPIALAEAWRPEKAREPWLGRTGLAIAGVVYIGAALLVASDPESHSASVTQLAISIALVIAAVALAWWFGRRQRRQPDRSNVSADPAPSVPAVFLTAVALGAIYSSMPETWIGFTISASTLGTTAALLWLASRRAGWGLRHIAAVGLGFMVARGLWAFAYYPLLGDVSAGPKYTHNVIMLLVVLLAGGVALSRQERFAAEGA